MRSRAFAADHEAAVARRLELLSAELAAVRGGTTWPDTRPTAEGDDDAPPGSAESWTPQGYTRIRAVPDIEEWPEDEVAAPPVPQTQPVRVPVPGRHAHRRLGGLSAAFSDALPDTMRGRVSIGMGPLAVVAAIVAVGLAVTCWWLLRGDSHELAAPVAVSTPRAALVQPSGAPGTSAATSAGPGVPAVSPSATKVVVDVAGKVRRPGIAVLRSGARIVDAIRAAGGVRPGVDLSALNLAQVLTDGQQIVVGGPAPPVASSAVSGSPVATLVNLNTADETTLESLPEVGPVTAQAIITWRTEHGGFSAVSQLLDIDGIGDATLAKLTPFVTL
jgi:competence protein ComEA